jgi:cytochrome c5
MEENMKRTSLLLAVVLTGACTTQQAMPPTDAQTLTLYEARCSACHSLPHPGRHTAQQWRHVVTLMERRMQERGHAPLGADERQRILDYLTRHAR